MHSAWNAAGAVFSATPAPELVPYRRAGCLGTTEALQRRAHAFLPSERSCQPRR
jgi:hypothetical protein